MSSLKCQFGLCWRPGQSGRHITTAFLVPSVIGCTAWRLDRHLHPATTCRGLIQHCPLTSKQHHTQTYANSTKSSLEASHPSTVQAQCCFTCVFELRLIPRPAIRFSFKKGNRQERKSRKKLIGKDSSYCS